MRNANYNNGACFRVGLLALLLSACKLDGSPEPVRANVDATLLTQSSQCWNNAMAPSVAWITSLEAYRSAYNQTRRHILGDANPPPEVDFTHMGVIAVYMGQHSTAGYQLALASKTAELSNDDELTLLVSWTEPQADTLLAQVITSPCILVSIPKHDYSVIRVVDEGHSVRASSKLQDD
jgi:hypothetical protein